MTLQKFGVRLNFAYTTQDFGLGELHVTEDGDHYRFMQADGAVTANRVYTYQGTTWQIEDFLELAVNPATAENIGCCVSGVTLADNEFAWVFVGPGNFTATSDGAIAADANIFGSATAGGLLDDAATACLLKGVVAQTAIGAATTGTFHAAYPLMAEDLN